jgi:hypothetical protein
LALAPELPSALEPDNAGLVPELLPELQEIEARLELEQGYNAFTAFVDARQLAGRPVRLLALTPQASPPQVLPPPPGKKK